MRFVYGEVVLSAQCTNLCSPGCIEQHKLHHSVHALCFVLRMDKFLPQCVGRVEVNRTKKFTEDAQNIKYLILSTIQLTLSELNQVWIMSHNWTMWGNLQSVVGCFQCGWRRRSRSREARGKQSHVKVRVCAHTIEPAGCFHKCKYWHLGWGRHWNQASVDWQQHFVYLHSKITSRHHLQYIFTPGSTKVWHWTKDSNKCVCVCVWGGKNPRGLDERTDSRRTARGNSS